jgi:multiple sugar transport system permease protein
MKRKHSRAVREERFWAAVFVAPMILGLCVFFYLALGASFVISFLNWSALSSPTWAGLANYARILSDPLLYASLINTFLFTLLNVPLGLLSAFIFALALNAIPKGKGVFRLVYFLPYLTLPVALAIVWRWMFNKSFGLFNIVLKAASLAPVDWLGDRKMALLSVVFYTVVTGMGYGIVIFLAGLKNISKEYYEAARMDGAGPFTVMRAITLPLLTPTLFYMVVTNTIFAFQVFDPIYILTKGGPLNTTRSIMFSVYEEGFRYFRFGTASAIAWILFAIIMVVTVVQLRLQKKWVYYG